MEIVCHAVQTSQNIVKQLRDRAWKLAGPGDPAEGRGNAPALRNLQGCRVKDQKVRQSLANAFGQTGKSLTSA